MLEGIVKEIIYVKEKREVKKPFGPAINRRRDKKYFRSNDLKFPDGFRKQIRKPYQHLDLAKLTKSMKVPAQKISIKTPEEVVEKLKEVKEKGMDPTQVEWVGPDEIRPIADVIEPELEKQRSLSTFLEVDKCVRRRCEEHWGTYQKPKQLAVNRWMLAWEGEQGKQKREDRSDQRHNGNRSIEPWPRRSIEALTTESLSEISFSH